jgi:hypothetical protein
MEIKQPSDLCSLRCAPRRGCQNCTRPVKPDGDPDDIAIPRQKSLINRVGNVANAPKRVRWLRRASAR